MRKLLNRSVLLASAGAVVGATAALAGSGVGGVLNLGQTNTVNAVTKLTGTTTAQQLLVVNSSNNRQSSAIYANGPNGSAGIVSTSATTGLSTSATAKTGVTYGVYATSASPDGSAGQFENTNTLPHRGVAVRGLSAGGSLSAFQQTDFYEGAGEFAGPNGVIGAATASTGSGVIGFAGPSFDGYGVYGSSSKGGYGVFGSATDDSGGGDGVGVYGYGSQFGLYSGNDAYVRGNLTITGNLIKGSGSFRIDHPLDPQNKYLSHSFVESPDMMNVYNGIVTTDAKGEAVVPLPSYFDALNRDPRYQLTVIGSFAAAQIAREESGNSFAIRTAAPNVRVSWQITGIRKDAYAVQHPIVVEEDKAVADRGHYLQPEAYGKPASLRIGAEREPQLPRQAAGEAPGTVEIAAGAQ